MLRSMNNLAQEINASHLKGYLLHFSSCYCHLCTDTVTKAHFRVFFPLCSAYGSLFQTLHGWKNDIHMSNFGFVDSFNMPSTWQGLQMKISPSGYLQD